MSLEKATHANLDRHSSNIEKSYLEDYHKQARDKSFEIGDHVLILMPNSSNITK